MLIFEAILILLFGAALLSILAKVIDVPYPALLAVAGVGVAMVPITPTFELPPELILALFVAPVLHDAAYDMSLRDLRRDWRPVLSLIVVAVGLTTAAVAVAVRWLMPDLPWGAAVALGALLAPPDAVAALAVMRQVNPPHRIRTILEGESLLNDASSLLIYRLAVAAIAEGGISAQAVVPTLLLVAIGSAVVGWGAAKTTGSLIRRVDDPGIATILQFVTTFGVWLLSERLGLSGVVTIVSFGLTAARASTSAMPTAVRVISFATWETVTFVLNVLAFLLVGLQLRPILPDFSGGQHIAWFGIALLLLSVVIIVRFAWVLLFHAFYRDDPNRPDAMPREEGFKGVLVVGWSGMRGIVTLAAALALPAEFPGREFILFTAFVVVLGTLLLQGLTLRPLLQRLNMPRDTVVSTEIQLVRAKILEAVLAALTEQEGPTVERLRLEYQAMLAETKQEHDSFGVDDAALRRMTLPHARRMLDELRDRGHIGDDAYRHVEQELDWFELSVQR